MRHPAMILCILILLLGACSTYQHPHNHHSHSATDCEVTPPPPYTPDPITAEQDAIYTLLAYAVVFKNWQTHSWDQPSTARGYNIGSVLVNPANPPGQQLACWARNSVITTTNGTQHGEVRLITNYLQTSENVGLKGYKLYTTLEPCAMCAGMMTLQSLMTTIYGQTDPNFGGAIARLTLDSTQLEDGWCPYPRGVQSAASPLPIRQQIDDAYAAAGGSITDWLTTPQAKALYQSAVDQLGAFQVKFPTNTAVLHNALEFLAQVPSQYTALPYTAACPASQ